VKLRAPDTPPHGLETHAMPTRAHATLLLALLLLSALQPFSPSALSQKSASSIFANTPVKNFSLPFFNDATGYREYLVRGDKATYVNASQIDIVALEFTQFTGDGSAIAKTRLTAPVATLHAENKQAPVLTGRESVHLAYENDLDATGEDWAYDHAQKTITINRNARIIYKNASDALQPRLSQLPSTPATDTAPAATTPATSATPTAPPVPATITSTALTLTQNPDGATFAVFTGNVTVATSDDLHLACDRLEVTAAHLRDKNPALTPLDKFQLLVATGNVRITPPRRAVTRGRADVPPREDRITLTQDAAVTDAPLRMTATGDPLTLHRADRRIEGKNVRITLPPLAEDEEQKPAANKQNPDDNNPASTSPTAATAATPAATIITAADFVMWQTPDNLTHATLDTAVTVNATDLALACEHLELTADTEKTQPPRDTTAEQQPAKQPPPIPPSPQPAGNPPSQIPSETTTITTTTTPSPSKLQNLRRLLATRNVRLTQGAREATCERAEVLPREDLVTLEQNPVLTDHAASARATADTFTLRRAERRITGENVRITLPPLKDLSALATRQNPEIPKPENPTDATSPATLQSPSPQPSALQPSTLQSPSPSPDSAPTTITSSTFAMWQPDGDPLIHAAFDNNVRVAATNLVLVSDHLALTANPAKPEDRGRKAANARAGGTPLTPEQLIMAQLHHVLATGRVHFTQLTREAYCDRAEVFPPQDRITLTGKPVITDTARQIVATGDKLTLVRGSQEIQGENIRVTTTVKPPQ
jgi:lipopolysaccharide export system protein LptA